MTQIAFWRNMMTTLAEVEYLEKNGLYARGNEHDSCGVGFVANIRGTKSHAIVKNALKILENLDHRGAVGADKLMGDGAGILLQLPDALYREEMAAQGVLLPALGEYGVGMIFLPKEHASRLACEQEMERAIKAEGQVLLGWRDVPVNREMPMSPTVRAKEPVMRQVFIGRGADVIVQDALERKLYVIRKTASAAIQNLHLKHSKEYYVPACQAEPSSIKDCCWRTRSAATFSTWKTSVVCPRSAWCTSASPPILFPSGHWPIPTDTLHTMARSIPSKATTTG